VLILHLTEATEQITRLGRSLFLKCWFRSSSLPVFKSLLPIVFICLLSSGQLSAAENIELATDQATSTAGYYQLNWKLQGASPDTIYIVTETRAGKAGQNTIYQGADTATVMSGKPNGSYAYVVRTEDGAHVSNQISVNVSHHSLTSAFIFFSLGAIVFVFILAAIYLGNKDQNINAD
jgi:hypothetical protein